jgi:hypothetical protein
MNLRDQLEAIYQQHGALSPQLLVDLARPDDHPLHPRLEWDDEIGGESFRLLQAGALIRSVRVVYKINEKTGVESRVRAFVSTREPPDPSAYKPTDEAMADPVFRALVLRNFERSILALKRQYGHLKEYDSMLRKHGLGEDTAA